MKKILSILAFPFVWIWNDWKKQIEEIENETQEEWGDRQW